jgi:hypothetical protein
MTQMIVPTNAFAAPADLYIGSTGATEPSNALQLPGSQFRHMGGTGAAATLTLSQTYLKLKMQQTAMAVGAELQEQMVTIATSLAEPTLQNLRSGLNQLPPSGTNEVQTVSLGSATAGSIQITFAGQQTAAIPYNATAATVQTALESLPNLNPGDVVVTGGPLPGAITLTFGGQYSAQDVPQVTVAPTGLTGGTVTVNTGTPGAPGPTLGVSGRLLNAQPNYASVLMRGRGPGGIMRLLILRKCLSTENVAMAWDKEGQTMIPVTFEGFYVSDSIDALWIDDRQA